MLPRLDAGRAEPSRIGDGGYVFVVTGSRAISASIGRQSVGEEVDMGRKASFKGSLTALVTPFENGGIDEEAFRGLIDWQIESGTHGLVPVGTTGESPTLSHEEHRRVVEICVGQAKGRVPVIAGAGSNNTQGAGEITKPAEKAADDGVLVVSPYYNKPNQEGLY